MLIIKNSEKSFQNNGETFDEPGEKGPKNSFLIGWSITVHLSTQRTVIFFPRLHKKLLIFLDYYGIYMHARRCTRHTFQQLARKLPSSDFHVDHFIFIYINNNQVVVYFLGCQLHLFWPDWDVFISTKVRPFIQSPNK